MVEAKPDAQMIDEVATYYGNLWEDAWKIFRKVDEFYWRTFNVWPQTLKSRGIYRPSTAANIIDHAVDNQMAYKPTVHRPIFEEVPEVEKVSSRIEKGLTNILIDAALRDPVIAWKQLAKHLIAYGYGVIYGPTLDYSDEPQEPEKESDETEGEFDLRTEIYKSERKNWSPFRIRAPHPSRVLLDPMEKQPSYAIVTGTRLVRDLTELSIKKMTHGREGVQIFEPLPDQKPWTPIRVLEFWSKDWHALKAGVVATPGSSGSFGDVTKFGGQLIFVEKNTWGFVPLTHGFASWGIERTSEESFNPKSFAVGILNHIFDSLVVQAQNFSARHTLLVNAAYAPLGARYNAEEQAQKIANEDMLEGEQGDIWQVHMNDVTRWMMDVGSEVDRDIEDGSFARHVAGRRERGVSTVGQQQILTGQANKKFVGPAEQVEEMATITGGRVLQLVDRLGEEFIIRGNSLRPQDIMHNYSVQVRFEIHDPVIELQRRQIGMQEVGMRLKSKKRYRADDARIGDEAGEAKQLLKEVLYEIPGVQLALTKPIAQEEGLEEILDEVLEQGAGPETPPTPNGASGNPPRQPLTQDIARQAPAGPQSPAR